MRNRSSTLLILSGFLGLCLGAIYGALLGFQIHFGETVVDPLAFRSERDLLRTAHAHLNSMSASLIMVGLTVSKALRPDEKLLLRTIPFAFAGSVLLFFLGLVAQAYQVRMGQATSVLVLVPSVVGGTLYIFLLIYWVARIWVKNVTN